MIKFCTYAFRHRYPLIGVSIHFPRGIRINFVFLYWTFSIEVRFTETE